MNRAKSWALLAVLGVLGSVPALGAEPAADAPIKVLILVGGHGYDEPAFDRLWKGFDGFACETWKGSPYTAFDDISQFSHDVIVMYNLSSGITDVQKQNFLKLLDRGAGLVVWHHALANCQDWPEFEKIAGAKFWLADGERDGVKVPRSGTGWGQFRAHVEDPQHPVTCGLTDFTVEDESYNKQTFLPGIHILVTTEHPASDKTLAWAHEYRKARVFGIQCGHDAKVWTNPAFQRLMAQGIRWTAARVTDAK